MTFEGLTFYEVASVTRVAGGIAMNVIPETCTAQVNFRYAPGRTPDEAEARLHELTQGLGSLRRVRPRALGRGRRRPSAGAKADPGRLAARRAQAGVDAGRRVRAGRLSGGELRAGRDLAGPPARRVDRDRRAAALLPGARGLRHVSVQRLPHVGRPGHVPVRAARAGAGAAAGGGRGDHRLRDGRAARGDAGVHPLRARRRDQAARAVPERGRPARAARGDRGLGGAPLRRGAGPGHAGDPDARLQGGRLRPRQRLRGRSGGRADAGLPGLRARRRLRGQARARAAADRVRRLAAGSRGASTGAASACCG